jgi:UDP:flavonoid glycosyltransferase YjiC (YdhE family)
MKFLILPENHSLSHIAKGLAVAEVLQAKGHEVLLGVSGTRSAFLQGRGVPWRVLPDLQDSDRSGYPTVDWFRDPRRLEACIRAEVALMEAFRPDRVLGVFRFSARASTQLAGVPYDALTCGCMLPEYEETLGFPPEDPGREEQALGLRAFYGFTGRGASRALARLGLPPVPDLRCLLKGDRTFLWDFPEFTPLPAGTGATHVGPVLWHGWPQDALDLEGLLASPHPLAILTFGTCVNSTRSANRLVAVLLELGFQVLLAAGGQQPLLEQVPRHPRLTVCKFAPLPLLFPKAALTVCHGGQLTVFEALAGGSPILVLPLQPEQAHNGLCLARLGCGRSLVPPQNFLGYSRVYTDAFEALEDRALRSAIETFLAAPGLHDRLATTRTLIQTYRGADTLATWMERS